MKHHIKTFAAGLAFALPLHFAHAQVSSGVVINEIYAGGGSSSASAAFRTDYVELFNNGPFAIDLSGFRLDYSPASRGAGVFDVLIGVLPVGSTIAAGGFFLIQTGSSGTGGGTDPTPNVDFATGASLSNAAGSIRLQDAELGIADLVGYGNLTNSNFEGAPETAPMSVAVSLFRAVDGADSNNNQLDFIQGAPNPMAVPEPSTYLLLGVGALLCIQRFRRRNA